MLVDKFVIKWRYGLYSEVQDDVGGDGRAGVLQGREPRGKNGARGICVVGEGVGATNAGGAGNYRRRKGNADV